MSDPSATEPHSAPAARHQIARIRRETRRRQVSVTAVEMLTPRMKRVVFSSPDLADFDSASHDDHVKLFFAPTASRGSAPSGRDFTPRRFDRSRATLTIDFVLHADGPAASWARDAAVGSALEIGGPRGSTIVPDDFDWYLLVGDESALPAIGRRVEELRAGVPVTTVVAIADGDERQSFSTAAAWRAAWVHREQAGDDDAATLVRALTTIDVPAGDGFVWIAAETAVARAVRRYVIEERRHPADWLKASAYWTRGRAGEHEPVGDGSPR